MVEGAAARVAWVACSNAPAKARASSQTRVERGGDLRGRNVGVDRDGERTIEDTQTGDGVAMGAGYN